MLPVGVRDGSLVHVREVIALVKRDDGRLSQSVLFLLDGGDDHTAECDDLLGEFACRTDHVDEQLTAARAHLDPGQAKSLERAAAAAGSNRSARPRSPSMSGHPPRTMRGFHGDEVFARRNMSRQLTAKTASS